MQSLSPKLAIHGGQSTVRGNIPLSTYIGAAEKEAVIAFMDRQLPLSGFHGSAQPTFFGGPEVRAFERAWARKFGSTHVVSMNSATSGLIAAMGAINIEPGDEVIIPPYTMSATAIAPIVYGGIPIFVDIEEVYFCLDIQKVRAAITTKTKAIIVVNLWGHPARLAEFRKLADEKKIYLIEDNAQAIMAQEEGVNTGCVGHIGVYSMNVHKHIQAGEGGIVVTEDATLAERLQLIRNHGENVTEWMNVENLSNILGFNFRQTEIGSVISRVQLNKVGPQVERVCHVAERLTQGIAGLKGLIPPKVRQGCSHSYFMWSLRFIADDVGCSRDAFVHAMQAEGVPLAQGYVPPLYRLPMFKNKIAIGSKGYPFNLSDVDYNDCICPVTERLHEFEIVQYQPVSWNPTDIQIDQMIESFHKVHAKSATLTEIA